MSGNAATFASVVGGFPSRTYRAGTTIFRTGDPGLEVYIVKSGEVELQADGRLLETVAEDGIFGEMALIDGSPRSAVAIAAVDTELAVITERQFLELISSTPFFALNIMRIMARRLRRATAGA